MRVVTTTARIFGALRTAAVLAVLPLFFLLLSVCGPFQTNAVFEYGGIALNMKPPLADGSPSIETNRGQTSQALGVRASLDLLNGHLPLWNHYEGLGAPLLGEVQSAALFPPTWLLLLPHGQEIEQALLQILAGVGTFLFLRQIGLGRHAALAGGVLFELNGVFAWLRNAIFNPVAFLPWLFLAVEILLAGVASRLPFRRRLPVIAFGAVLAALALYAGFPEEVYLYGLMLVAWTLFRAASLTPRCVLRLSGDVLLTGILALALSAPMLAAFADFLGQAELGNHAGKGFAGWTVSSIALLQYLSPYVYGRISASDEPPFQGTWLMIGGYVGFVPVVLALASLLVSGRRAVKLFMFGWIVLAVGVSQGVPGLYQAFLALPLVSATAYYRYLNASWIFAFVVLAALFIDAAPALRPDKLQRTVLLGVAGGLLALAIATALAWPHISAFLAHSAHNKRTFAYDIAAMAALLALVWWAAQRGRAAPATLSSALVLEAVAWFAYPYLCYPRGGILDLDLIAFLRANLGYERVANSPTASLGVNYGSYFGVSLLHYTDLPVPKQTYDYVKRNLNPYAGGDGFFPWTAASGPDGPNGGRRYHAFLPAYARAGVKYVLADADLDYVSPYVLSVEAGTPIQLAPRQAIELAMNAEPKTRTATSAVSVRVAGLHEAGSGALRAMVCVGDDCAEGMSDVVAADQDRRLLIELDRQLTIEPGAHYTVRVAREGGAGLIALATFKLMPGTASADNPPAFSGADVEDDQAPELLLKDDNIRFVHASRSMRVYELSGTRPYFSADGCVLTLASRDSVEASCAAASQLLRLEVAMRGWSVQVNGAPTVLREAEDTFQEVALPAGLSRVEFSYEPALFRPALALAGLALLVIGGVGVAWALAAMRAR